MSSIKNKCSTTELKMLGDFWALMVIQTLNSSEKRFAQLAREVPLVNPRTLTNRLKKLEKQGIVERKKKTIDKLSVTYNLTEKGKGILPVLEQIKIFADKYLNKQQDKR